MFFEPTTIMFQSFPLATLLIPLSFLGQSADLKMQHSICIYFSLLPKRFYNIACTSQEMLQNTIQICCTEELIFFPVLTPGFHQPSLPWCSLDLAEQFFADCKEFILRRVFNTQQIVFLYIVSFLCCMLLLVSA